MKKNKTKLTLHDKKVVDARHRNEYLLRVHKLLNEMGLRQAYPTFSPNVLNFIYFSRGQFMKVQADDEYLVHAIELKKLQVVLYDWCKNKLVPIKGTEYQMRLIDFYEIWYPLIVLIKVLKDKDENLRLDQKPEIFEIFDKFIDFEDECLLEQIGIAKESLLDSLSYFSIIGSSIPDKIYWMELNENAKETDPRMRRYVTIHTVKAQSVSVKHKNNSRPAYRVGVPMANEGIRWLTMAPASWGSVDENADQNLDVYIQSHALNRMHERIDGLPIQMCILNLFVSIISNPRVLIRDNDFLIEYKIEGLKVGYVVASLHKKIIVIRTFLFITYNGTPEGQKLSEITGLGKLDKKYLAIDKLSSFYSSDIRENPLVADIFSRAGCADLLQAEKIKYMINTKYESSFSSNQMLKYMNLLEPSFEVDLL